jgi:hypothetical protein
VSVLARYFEKHGLSTVVVTMMPYWSKIKGIPRTVGVEVPFGHPYGLPNKNPMQKRVLNEAIRMLQIVRNPGEVWELDIAWPQSYEEAYHASHPEKPSPIINYLREKALAEARRKRGKHVE